MIPVSSVDYYNYIDRKFPYVSKRRCEGSQTEENVQTIKHNQYPPLPLAFNKGGPATQDELLEVNLGWHDPVTHQNSVHARWRPASHNGVKKLFINLLLIKQSPNRLVDACLLQNPLETVEIVARPTSEARTSIDGSEMEKTYVVGKFGPRIFPNHI